MHNTFVLLSPNANPAPPTSVKVKLNKTVYILSKTNYTSQGKCLVKNS